MQRQNFLYSPQIKSPVSQRGLIEGYTNLPQPFIQQSPTAKKNTPFQQYDHLKYQITGKMNINGGLLNSDQRYYNSLQYQPSIQQQSLLKVQNRISSNEQQFKMNEQIRLMWPHNDSDLVELQNEEDNVIQLVRDHFSTLKNKLNQNAQIQSQQQRQINQNEVETLQQMQKQIKERNVTTILRVQDLDSNEIMNEARRQQSIQKINQRNYRIAYDRSMIEQIKLDLNQLVKIENINNYEQLSRDSQKTSIIDNKINKLAFQLDQNEKILKNAMHQNNLMFSKQQQLQKDIDEKIQQQQKEQNKQQKQFQYQKKELEKLIEQQQQKEQQYKQQLIEKNESEEQLKKEIKQKQENLDQYQENNNGQIQSPNSTFKLNSFNADPEGKYFVNFDPEDSRLSILNMDEPNEKKWKTYSKKDANFNIPQNCTFLVTSNGEIFIIGGQLQQKTLSKIYKVGVERNQDYYTIQEFADLLIPRHSHSAIFVHNSIYIAGGQNEDGQLFQFEKMDFDTENPYTSKLSPCLFKGIRPCLVQYNWIRIYKFNSPNQIEFYTNQENRWKKLLIQQDTFQNKQFSKLCIGIQVEPKKFIIFGGNNGQLSLLNIIFDSMDQNPQFSTEYKQQSFVTKPDDLLNVQPIFMGETLFLRKNDMTENLLYFKQNDIMKFDFSQTQRKK